MVSHILAIISMIRHRVREPARLVVQLVELRHQANSNHPPHSGINDCDLQITQTLLISNEN